jgi:hypothetical protein
MAKIIVMLQRLNLSDIIKTSHCQPVLVYFWAFARTIVLCSEHNTTYTGASWLYATNVRIYGRRLKIKCTTIHMNTISSSKTTKFVLKMCMCMLRYIHNICRLEALLLSERTYVKMFSAFLQEILPRNFISEKHLF